MSALRLAGIEAGGTKFVCLVGAEDGTIVRETRFDTRSPVETLAEVVGFFRATMAAGERFDACGIASFGPIELRRDNSRYGFITTTPKAGWSDVDLLGAVSTVLDIPIGFDTDVNGAALAEGRWGAAHGCTNFVYLTIGTGVGGGAVVAGRPLHGLVHPEMGHMSVPRQEGDVFAGVCPFHGDCFEGMASGTAMRERWGRPAQELRGTELERALDLEARYIAAGCRTVVYTLAPQRIVLGGGVSMLPGLVDRVRERLSDDLAGYPGLAEHRDLVVLAGLGREAGPAGALALAHAAWREAHA